MTKMTVSEGLHAPVDLEDPKGKLTTSERIWTIFVGERASFVVGVWRETFLGVPYVWFIRLDFRLGDLRHMSKLWRTIFNYYSRLEALVLTGDEPARRFAEWFGFRRVRNEGDLIRYEVRRG